MSTALTDAPTERTSRPKLLHGLPWLVMRQHRATLYCVLAAVVLGASLIAYGHHTMAQALDAAGWPEKSPPQPVMGSRTYSYVTLVLNALPVALAVFLGAPLIAGDQEQGTAQLVTTQSVTRRRWLIAKLTWCCTVALFAGAVLSAFFTWWWRPYRSFFPHTWVEGTVFDNTGPVLPAFCLFLTALGITVGMVFGRTLMAMTVTFVASVAVGVAWGELRTHLAPPRTFAYPLNDELPARLADSHELDRWVGSADGRLFGWGTCAEQTDAATNACVKEHGIVNNVVEYLGYDQMTAMQWTGAAILLAGTAALTAFVLWRASRRPL